MPKHKTSHRIVFVCTPCAYLAGKVDTQFDTGAKWYQSTCDICRRRGPVTDAKSWGFFTPAQAKQAKAALLTLGLDRRTFANLKDVKNLVAITQEVLGVNTSDATKAVLKKITDRLEQGQPIEMFDAKALTYCFTQDAAAMKTQEELKVVKKKKREKSNLIKKATGLVVVENGRVVGDK